MARYYFDVNDGKTVEDRIGREVADLTSLRRESLQLVTRRAADDAQDGRPSSVVLQVRDDRGAEVLTVNLVCQVVEPSLATAPRS